MIPCVQSKRLALLVLIGSVIISIGCSRQTDPTSKDVDHAATATKSSGINLQAPAVAELPIVSTTQIPNLPPCNATRCLKMSIQHVKTGQPWLDARLEAELLKLTDMSVTGQKYPKQTIQQNIQRFIDESSTENPSEMVITTELINQQGTIAVFRLIGNYYLGGAHGDVIERYLNADLKQQKILQLSDVLQTDATPRLETLVYGRYLDWIKQNVAGQPIDAYQAMYPFKMSQQWYLDKTALVFVYQEHDIGPYVAGLSKFELPYTQLTSILKPAFLPTINDDPIAPDAATVPTALASIDQAKRPS